MMVRCPVAIGGALCLAGLGAAPAAFARAGFQGVEAPVLGRGVARSSAAVGATPVKQPSAAELASARRLFAVAISAEDRGRWVEALETYERVSKVAVSPSLWYHIGVCHEALGHLVEAVNAFDLAVSGATARRELALSREARSRLERLRARTAQVVLGVPRDAADVRIEIDGQPLNPALAGAAVLVAPGDRRIVVRAGNYREVFDTTVRAAAGDVVEMRAELGRKKPRVAPGPRLDRGSFSSAQGPSAQGPVQPTSSLVPAFLVGGTAVALAAGAVVTGVVAYDVRETYLRQNASPAPGSRAERESLRDKGQLFAITSTALTGGALLAGGIATYLLWPSSRADTLSAPPSRSVAVLPWAGVDGAGVHLRGVL
jgi:hypothetical protein